MGVLFLHEAHQDSKGLEVSRWVRENTKGSACKGKKGALQRTGGEMTGGETWEATQNLLACMAGSLHPDQVAVAVHSGLVQQLQALSAASPVKVPPPVTPGDNCKDPPSCRTPKWSASGVPGLKNPQSTMHSNVVMWIMDVPRPGKLSCNGIPTATCLLSTELGDTGTGGHAFRVKPPWG